MNESALNPVRDMATALTKKWWVFLVQGIVMIVLAYLALAQPTTLIQFIGAYAIIDGVLKLFSGFGPKPGDQSRWPALLIGALSIIVGAVLWLNPGLAAEVVTYLVAAWAIVVGALLVVWGLRLRKEISTEWLMILLGILSLVFGVLVLANVQAGFYSLQVIFAIYMALGAVLSILLALQIRNIGVRIGAVG